MPLMPPVPRWQDQYAQPNWTRMLTMLDPAQEMKFQQWVEQNKIPITPDYDMRAYWMNGAKGGGINPSDQRFHFPDTYKTPLHQSFSGESIFANPASKPPMWKGNQLIDSQGTVVYSE